MKNGKTYQDKNQLALMNFYTNDSLFYTNNTFFGNSVPGIKLGNNGGGTDAKTFITNNIFFRNDVGDIVNADIYSQSSRGKFVLKNNFFTKDPTIDKYISLLDAEFANNLVANDPIFSDTVQLTLDPSSPLINSGTNKFGTNNSQDVSTKDLYGNTRPSAVEKNADIGAVESEFSFPSPVLVSLDGGDKSVSVKWSKPVNGTISGYEIFRSTSTIPSSTNSGAVFTINVADSLNVTDTAKVNLTRYYYRVRAFSGTTNKIYSGLSNELSVRPNVPPTGIDTVITFAGPRNVAVRWKDTSSVKRKYNVYRGVTSTSFDKIAQAVDTTFYVDKSVTPNTKYFYAVSVIDSVGASSALSKSAFATPTNIWAVDTSGKSLNNGSAGLPFKSIQYAIDNSVAGDTIMLNDGLYEENLVLIKKSVVLIAKNRGKVTIQPLNNNSPLFIVRDENPWGTNSYDKPRNQIIGISTESSYTIVISR